MELLTGVACLSPPSPPIIYSHLNDCVPKMQKCLLEGYPKSLPCIYQISPIQHQLVPIYVPEWRDGLS